MKFSPLIFCILFFDCCRFLVPPQTKQEKAEKLAKSWLTTHLGEPNSYISIKFSKIKPVLTSLNDSPNYLIFVDSLQSAQSDLKYIKTALKNAINPAQRVCCQHEIDKDKLAIAKYHEKIKETEKHFVVSQKFWYIENQYKAKDNFGQYITRTGMFYLDTALTKTLIGFENQPVVR